MTVTYRDAGVDIDAGDELVRRIKPIAAATRTVEAMQGVGGFAGLCGLPADIPDPILVSGTDGVGTKLKVAFATQRHDTIGQDLVAMCVNDVITTGARPLFFLDYFGCGALDVDVAEQVVRGIGDGCQLAGCALLGGETAELPGMYAAGEYDLAGFAVGVVSKGEILGRQRVQAGDALVAIASSGLHSNGYSLARRVLIDTLGLEWEARLDELDQTLADALLTPTRIYAQTVGQLTKLLGSRLHALCHVTGGGVPGNLVRILNPSQHATVRMDHERSGIFDIIQRGGPVAETEMQRTFNLGIGMVCCIDNSAVDEALAALKAAGETAWLLGSVEGDSAEEDPSVRVVK